MEEDDPLRLVREAGTAAPNDDMSPGDILRTLTAWRERCDIEVLSAGWDRGELRFKTLPADVEAFAAEVAAFCPDLIDQGMAVAIDEAPEMLSDDERKALKRFLAEDKGGKKGRTERVAIRMLARHLELERQILLWWD